MKNLTVCAASRSIEVSKKFNTLASRYGTEEYKALQEVRRDYPGFKVVEVSTRKAPKSTYKGLTYDYMENYILSHDDGKNSVMNEYMNLRAMTVEAEEACAEACSYQEIKTWFLDKYPAIAASTRESPRETFFNTSRGQSPLPWLGSNDALPLATRMETRLPWRPTRGSLTSPSYLVRDRTLGPPLENNPEIPPSSRAEGLRLLHGLGTNLATSLQTPWFKSINSSSVHTRPVGFCGLHQKTSLAWGLAHCASKLSKSIEYSPFSSRFRGDCKTLTPA